MKIYQSKKSRSLGFTLVELLIVVSILSLLTVAVLAAINPLEQLKKGRDTQRKADAATLLAASERFQATFGCYPWKRPASVCNTWVLPYTTVIPAAFTGYLRQLLEQDEIKTQFTSRSTVTTGDITSYEDPATGQASFCFTPESKSARNGALGPIVTKYNSPTGADCSGAYSRTDVNCAVCVPQ